VPGLAQRAAKNRYRQTCLLPVSAAILGVLGPNYRSMA